MRISIATFFALSISFAPLSAQVSTGGLPYGLRQGLPVQELPAVRSAAFDAAAVALEDAAREAEGKIPTYGRILAVNAGLHNAGLWTSLPNGDRVWRLRVVSEGALATELYYADLHIPNNASLYVYSEDGETVLGGFTAYNNTEDGLFTTSLVPGDASILEYYEPAEVMGEGSLTITGVGHAYRFVDEVSRAAGACEVDVNCSEGANWQAQRDAVVRMSIVQGGFSYWCSGALVNNLDQDCKPYFLSAQHCDEGSTQAELNQWKFYFNYERSGCGTGTAPSNRTVTGFNRRGASNDGGGDSGSDFLLVEAKNAIPSSYNPYWAGWDATGVGSTGGVGIHHPDGDRKKISTYTMTTASSSWNGPAGTHWRVQWAATANGHGVTEGGSSGSPLFNSSKRIIGTLTGGSSYCSAPNGYDYYGKMSYHWQSNPGPTTMRLKNFLDPQNTGTKTMDGSYFPCSPVGVGEAAQAPERLALYPNPADAAVAINVPQHARNSVLEVFDMGGRLIHGSTLTEAEQHVLNTTELENGAYLVRMSVQGRVIASAPLIVAHP